MNGIDDLLTRAGWIALYRQAAESHPDPALRQYARAALNDMTRRPEPEPYDDIEKIAVAAGYYSDPASVAHHGG